MESNNATETLRSSWRNRLALCALSILNTFACYHGQAQVNPGPYKSFADSSYVVGDKVIAPKIQFSNAGIRILPAFYDSVAVVAVFLEKHPSIHIEISVHTDGRGHAAYNLDLSQARAESVRYLLVERFGISPERLTATGYGESVPLLPPAQIENTVERERKEALYHQNQRIEIRVK